MKNQRKISQNTSFYELSEKILQKRFFYEITERNLQEHTSSMKSQREISKNTLLLWNYREKFPWTPTSMKSHRDISTTNKFEVNTKMSACSQIKLNSFTGC
jgi:hypothetical protein